MSNIESLDRLREFVEEDAVLVSMIENVEHEIAERYIPLPVDADGVPIHTGDLMERCCEEDTERFIAWFFAANGDALDDETLFFKPLECRHYKPRTRHVKPRTIEDVLAAFAAELHSDRIDSLDRRIERCAARYADEIRELMGVGE